VQILFPDQFVSEGKPAPVRNHREARRDLIDCEPQCRRISSPISKVSWGRGRGGSTVRIEAGSASRVATLDGVFFDRTRAACLSPPRYRFHHARDAHKLEGSSARLRPRRARETEAHEKRAAIMAVTRTQQDEMGAMRTALVAEERAFEGVT